MGRRVLWMLVLLMCVQRRHVGAFNVFAKSELQRCERDGGDAGALSSAPSCRNLIVTAITISNNEHVSERKISQIKQGSQTKRDIGTSGIRSQVVLLSLTSCKALQEPSGELKFTNWKCKAANGTELQMRYGIRATLTKGQTWLHYPIDYERTLNYAPYEEIIYTKHDECLDDPKQNDVTCGWCIAWGKRQPDSQVLLPSRFLVLIVTTIAISH